ncbi:MAG: hypothetical protein Q4D89_10740 [Arachnia propionica]|uniref:hypothetical protein n=1 Tax=Arachnia propionica TaxID=1750 RepID=UPI00270D2B19|nr:hypothetical protein [Arachnia propionica]
MDPRQFLETTDWAHLDHAYGFVTSREVAILAGLLDGDRDALIAAEDLLDASFFHQGNLYLGTPAAFRVLVDAMHTWPTERLIQAGFEDELIWHLCHLGRRIHDELDDPTEPVRPGEPIDHDAVAAWNRIVDEVLVIRTERFPTLEARRRCDEELWRRLWRNQVVGLIDLVPDVIALLLPLTRGKDQVSRDATEVLVPWLTLPGAEQARVEVTAGLRRDLDAQLADPGPGLIDVLWRLHELDEDLTPLLDHPDLEVRGFAALSRPDPATLDVLVKAVVASCAVAEEAVYELGRMKPPLERVVPAVVAWLQRMDHVSLALGPWQWLIVISLPTDPEHDPWRILPDRPSPAQLDVLEAVAANPVFWERSFGGRRAMGLGEMTRDDLVTLLGTHGRPGDGVRSTGAEVAEGIAALTASHPDRDGADWLRALHPLVEAAGPGVPTRAMLLALLEAALVADAPPMDEAWRRITQPPELEWPPGAAPPPGEPDPTGHAEALAVIAFQAAELDRLAEAGRLGEVGWGVASPTGNTWYNATSHTLLECGAAALEDHDLTVVWGWRLLAQLLELGRSYE